MALVEWAKAELNRLIPSDDTEGKEMQEQINKDILEVVKVFSEQGHSGFSANYALGIITRLLDWKPITPLTGEDEEWGPPDTNWNNSQQNKRCSAVFRENFDNSTAFYINGKIFSDNGGVSWFTCRDSRVPATFPYKVPEKPEKIILENGETEG